MLFVPYSSYRLLRIKDILLLPIKTFIWWYTGGIVDVFRFTSYHVRSLEDIFSFREMLLEIPKFSPLHKDTGGAFLDKVVARLIGVVFRIGWVFATGLVLLFALLLSMLLFVVWIILPLLILFEFCLTVLSVLGMEGMEAVHNGLFRFIEDTYYSFF